MKRVVLFKNGSQMDGKVVLWSGCLKDLLSIASTKFQITAKRLFTSQGGEIDDPSLIKNEEILYVSEGEPFKAFSESSPQFSLLRQSPGSQDWVFLNVGGQLFATTRSTLVTKEPTSMLARMFSAPDGSFMSPSAVDFQGAFLIDRSPVYFEPLLNYLRHGQLILDKNVNPAGVLEEAKFFGIESVTLTLETIIQEEQGLTDHSALSRRDVITSLVSTSHVSELRFQGVNLEGADLSKLDLRHINFKYANLRNSTLKWANLSFCCLERADLSHANLEGAVLLGVKMLCANLEGAILQGCNMEDPAGCRANMEGVNLKGANLEGSQMAGVNLRVATLKNANLQNCDLRGAVLAGADLENCDLSGSDLHEANLRGANLKDAAFELMLTPLHMSQAIR
ncbi:BTB/POZ domain-containing protein KCTD9-like [Limulus polyphemus]|uniref:BTB/POZ domain-containing protein KCTD9-like n=1 Tax=Limulus polyphemus TaxID=6850 RepID=A0ABM1BMN7_LIMPO|nr:BTB/POZ domain-containing protein KCTD9-like [Limulus polyphemus]